MMKKITFLAILFLFLAGGGQITAQSDCNAHFPFKEGVTMQYTSYNKKDKPESVATHTVSGLQNADGVVQADIKTKLVDDKGKDVFEGSYQVKCQDDVLYMDMSRLMPAEMMASMGEMEATVEGDGLVLPNRLEIGQTLPDASMTVSIGAGGMSNLMKTTLTVSNRKVAGRESVTTPAGTFDCFKITQDTQVKSIMSRTYSSAEWYAEGVGVVKSETFDKKGGSEGYMLLTKLER